MPAFVTHSAYIDLSFLLFSIRGPITIYATILFPNAFMGRTNMSRSKGHFKLVSSFIFTSLCIFGLNTQFPQNSDWGCVCWNTLEHSRFWPLMEESSLPFKSIVLRVIPRLSEKES